MAEDGVSRADCRKGGDGMESDLDGLTCCKPHHPYPVNQGCRLAVA